MNNVIGITDLVGPNSRQPQPSREMFELDIQRFSLQSSLVAGYALKPPRFAPGLAKSGEKKGGEIGVPNRPDGWEPRFLDFPAARLLTVPRSL